MRKHRQQIVVMSQLPRSARIPMFQIAEDLSLYKPASFVQRWYAFTLDLAFLGPINILFEIPFVRYMDRLEAFDQKLKLLVMSFLLIMVPLLFYVVVPTWLGGQTLGKRIVGIKVVRSDFGSSLTFTQILTREIFGKFLIILSLGLGLLSIFSTKRGRALHDRVSQTSVIDYR